MFKGRSRGLARGRPAIQKVPLKGLFSDGVWHCNCAPRLPAQRFQTKNGGKNHGRWCTSPHAGVRRTSANPLMVYSLYMPTTSAQALRFLPLGRRCQVSRGHRGLEQLSYRASTTSAHPHEATTPINVVRPSNTPYRYKWKAQKSRAEYSVYPFQAAYGPSRYKQYARDEHYSSHIGRGVL